MGKGNPAGKDEQMTPPWSESGIFVEKDVWVPMRDGVRLSADVYRPAEPDGGPAEGRFPVLLVRTSYDKRNPEWDGIWPYYVERGYVFVLQDLRSRFRSEGDGRYFHTCNPWDADDGYDTVEWIAAQPWSNGRVGTLGSSHRAITQTLLALRRPPHLSAQWIEVGPTNIYAHEAREGGAMCFHMFGAIHMHAWDCHELKDNPEGVRVVADAIRDMRGWVQRAPFKPGETALRVAPSLEKTLFDYYYRGDYDEFWAQECCNQEPYLDRHADVPLVLAGGWCDPFAVATTDYFVQMAKQNENPTRLVMGPWNHGGMRANDSWAGEVDFGRESVWGNAVYNPERLRWFDRWLKDADTGVENDASVRIFVMGGGDGRRNADGRLNHGGHWRDEQEWPLARTQYETRYLRTNGRLTADAPRVEEAPLALTFDPEHPVPTVGGNVTGFIEIPRPEDGGPALDPVPPFLEQRAAVHGSERQIVPPGPMHQRERPELVGCRPPYPLLADRPDVLAFQTEPLEADVEITGAVEVKLWVSSSAVDTDFTMKLLDIYPPSVDYPEGFHMNLADTILRCRYRNSWAEPEMMSPGEVYPVTIKLPPISNLFQAGHRIRLDVSSSNFPRFDVNPNTGEPMGRHTHTVKAENAVYLDRERPSGVVLPLVPEA